MVTDPSSNYCHLKLHWASKSNLEQRAGRVGRVSDGRVFRLITNDFYDVSGKYSYSLITKNYSSLKTSNIRSFESDGTMTPQTGFT